MKMGSHRSAEAVKQRWRMLTGQIPGREKAPTYNRCTSTTPPPRMASSPLPTQPAVAETEATASPPPPALTMREPSPERAPALRGLMQQQRPPQPPPQQPPQQPQPPPPQQQQQQQSYDDDEVHTMEALVESLDRAESMAQADAYEADALAMARAAAEAAATAAAALSAASVLAASESASASAAAAAEDEAYDSSGGPEPLTMAEASQLLDSPPGPLMQRHELVEDVPMPPLPMRSEPPSLPPLPPVETEAAKRAREEEEALSVLF